MHREQRRFAWPRSVAAVFTSRLVVCAALLAALLIGACKGSDRAPSKEAPAQPLGARAGADARAPGLAQPPAPFAIETAPLREHLATRAFSQANHGDVRGACRAILNELDGRLRAPAAAAPRDALTDADSLVATLVLWQLVENHELWAEVAPAVDRLARIDTNAECAAYLRALDAAALRRTGAADRAFELSRSQAFVTDWRILGPFDNERGKGFDATNVPTGALDWNARQQGKAREVGWRVHPAPDHPSGFVVLDDVLRPNTQVLAYLATAVRSEKARDVALHVATSGAFKVFVNDEAVLARNLHRPAFLDQDRVVVALQPGWNRIVVQSGTEDAGDWIVGVRVCGLDGAPLALAVDSSHASEAPPQAQKATAKLAPRARDVLEARAKEDADAARLLALLHLISRPNDRAEHPARAAVALALQSAPKDVDTLYLQALAAAPDEHTSREELEIEPWIAPLKEVVRLDPAHVAATCDLARFYLEHEPLPRRADELSAAALRAAPNDARAIGVRIGALNDLELSDEADELSLDLHTRLDAWSDAGVSTRASQERVHGRPDAALAALEQGFERMPLDTGVFRELLSAYTDRNRAEDVERATERALRASPSSIGVRLAASAQLEALGDLARARTLLERAHEIAPEDTDVLLALARLDQRSGDVPRSLGRLDEILALDPTQDKVRRQRELLGARDSDHFEAPYRWDAREVLANASKDWAADEPFTVLERTHVHKVNKDGTYTSYEHVLLRVQNDGGVKALDAYGLFYPQGASLSVKRVRLLHADGSAQAAPAPRGGDRWNGAGSVRVYDLPPLKVGDAIEVEAFTDVGRPSVFGNYFGLRDEFYSDQPDALAPVLRSELVVIAAPDLELHFVEHDASSRLEKTESVDDKGRKVRRYVARELARPKPESAMPRRSELAPRVDVTTYADWQAFASWWWSFIQKEFVSSPALEAKVKELTENVPDPLGKVRALVRFVGQEIRYNAWPFGTHGYEPFSAPTIFERRFGDCKDKSILLCEMLSQIGVHAHPVLIKAEYFRPDEPLDAAMVEHFNHCIAYLPAQGDLPGMYLDCTADRNPIEYLRSDDQGARVLHVDGGKGSLHDIPYAPPAENQMVRRYEVTLDAKGDGDVHLVDESNGAFGVRVRTNYGGEKGDVEKRLERELRESFTRVDVKDVKTTAFEDLAVPPRLDVRFKARKLWAAEQGGASLRLSFDALGIERAAVEPLEQRTHDIVLDRPFALDSVISYRLPEGARATTLPPRVEVRVPGMLSYVQEVRADEQGVEVRRRFELEKRRIPLAEYGEFQSALREIQLADQRTIRLELPSKSQEKR